MKLRDLATATLLSLALASCTTSGDPAGRRVSSNVALPPMKVFGTHRAIQPSRSNAEIARDFLDLSFQLESGRTLPVFTRFEGPITLRLKGDTPRSLDADLKRLLKRLKSEAQLDVRSVPASHDAAITIETVPRDQLQRAVPEAACFVVPRVSSWGEFLSNRRGGRTDWTTLRTRERLAIFIPSGVPPQEVRDCLHEEVAQAMGPLNDLYRLKDSVFNDDNFHTVLTGFDMLILRVTYAPELRSGMTRAQVAARLPAILARLNPAGSRSNQSARTDTSRAWIDAIERALGPRASMEARRRAAARAVSIARARGWNDNRLAFSLFALGRLSMVEEPELALSSFLQAAGIYGADPETAVHGAHIAMQLAVFSLSSGEAEAALAIVDANTSAVIAAENASLLATLLLVKSEALELLGRTAEARSLRSEALGWARYGFGSDDEVRRRANEIASISPAARRPS